MILRLSLNKDKELTFCKARNNFRPKLLQKSIDIMFASSVINNG